MMIYAPSSAATRRPIPAPTLDDVARLVALYPSATPAKLAMRLRTPARVIAPMLTQLRARARASGHARVTAPRPAPPLPPKPASAPVAAAPALAEGEARVVPPPYIEGESGHAPAASLDEAIRGALLRAILR